MRRRLRPGGCAPALRLERAGGGTFDLADARGRRVLVSFHRYAT